jgi:allantoinase
MSMYDCVIRHATLVIDTDPTQGILSDLAIADGQIVAIEPEIVGNAAHEIDARGLHVFPGVIDAHVHFNEPGRADWEGIATGSRALAAGGGTAFFDMPLNAHPPTLDGASFDQKCSVAERTSITDFALWGGLVPGNLDHIDELADRGVIGFKAFMSNSGIDDFAAVDDWTLYEGMTRAAKLGHIVAVHAENDQITTTNTRRAIVEGRTSARDYLNSRPVVAELEAIERAILFAKETGCKLHVVHVSTGRGVGLVARARAEGLDVSCETCPHYLLLTEDDVETLGAVAKCAPPLRSQDEQDMLWKLLSDGQIPMVASDHSPAPPDMKLGEDFFKIWGGISGCQSTLELLLTAVYNGRNLGLSRIAAVTSAYVADRFAIAPHKGRLAIGADADLALVDLAREHTLQSDDLFYRHQQSPYVGRRLHGRVTQTLVRGQTVFENGKIVGAPCGKLITPSAKGMGNGK